MKRKKEIKEQTIFNTLEVEKINDDCYKIKKIQGKLFQKLLCETKFKQFETIKFDTHCLNKEMTASLIQLKRIKEIDNLNEFITPNVVIYKHLLSNGYKIRPISNDLIGIIDIKNHESIIKVIQFNENLNEELFNQKINNPFIEHIGIAQNDSVVFISIQPSQL